MIIIRLKVGPALMALISFYRKEGRFPRVDRAHLLQTGQGTNESNASVRDPWKFRYETFTLNRFRSTLATEHRPRFLLPLLTPVLIFRFMLFNYTMSGDGGWLKSILILPNYPARLFRKGTRKWMEIHFADCRRSPPHGTAAVLM